ncbi:MAG: hypothetical protein OEZ58_13315 [Gammaproteobacteria bacterium]|nr:hypothetical protein [Gammaproteobacteria bacterium]MDH5729968.1 hypothetical protein [Gammaproteobacteria bacterium]
MSATGVLIVVCLIAFAVSKLIETGKNRAFEVTKAQRKSELQAFEDACALSERTILVKNGNQLIQCFQHGDKVLVKKRGKSRVHRYSTIGDIDAVARTFI